MSVSSVVLGTLLLLNCLGALAKDDFDTAAKRMTAMFDAGHEHYKNKQFTEAIAYFQATLEEAEQYLPPDNAGLGHICTWLGITQFEVGQLTLARANLERADQILSQKPREYPVSYGSALSGLAAIHRNGKSFAQADRYLQRLQEVLRPDSPEYVSVLTRRARLAGETGNDDAKQALSKAAADSEDRWFNIAHVRTTFAREAGDSIEFTAGEVRLDNDKLAKLRRVFEWLEDNQGRFRHVSVKPTWFQGAEECAEEEGRDPGLPPAAQALGRGLSVRLTLLNWGLPNALVGLEAISPETRTYPKEGVCESLRVITIALD